MIHNGPMLAYNDLYGLHHFWLWYYPYKVFAWTFLYGYGYQYWSGVGLIIFVPFMYWYHHNCHVRGCLRLGKPDPVHGWHACRHHHTMKHLLGVDPHQASETISEPLSGESVV